MVRTRALAAATLSIILIIDNALGHSRPIHQDLADLAMRCAEREQGTWLPSTYRNLLLDGSWQEDYIAPFYNEDDPVTGGIKTRNHGYNPITNSTGGIFLWGLGNRATDYSITLWEEMRSHFRDGQIESGHNPWNSEDLSAYHWLGRTCHLIQDMTTHPHIHPQNIDPFEHKYFEDWENSIFHGDLGGYISDSLSPLQPTDSLPSEATAKLDTWSKSRLQSKTFYSNGVASFLEVVARITYFRTTFWGEVEFVNDTYDGSSGDATQENTREATFSDGTVPGYSYKNTLRTMFGAGNVRYRNSWTDDWFEITDANGQPHTWKGVGDDEWFPCAGSTRDGSVTTGSDPTNEGVRTVGRFHFVRADEVKPLKYPDGTGFYYPSLGYSYTKYAWQAGVRYNAGLILAANQRLRVTSTPGSTGVALSRTDNLGNADGITGSTGFVRYFVTGEQVTLTANAWDTNGRPFKQWLKNSVFSSTNRSITVNVADEVEYSAVYTEPFCGDGSCNGSEDCCTCQTDCGSCCGNGSCDCGETHSSCQQDCPATCGDGSCNGSEDCCTCQTDCGSCCGNGFCDCGETHNSCSQDCPAICGDGSCNGSEDCCTCPTDCGLCCGNGACDCGETHSACPQDCPATCGDGSCNGSEDCCTCQTDCGSCCGNGSCDCGETYETCPQDCSATCGDGSCNGSEDCCTCQTDCGSCCGNDTCDCGETHSACPQDCPAACGNGTCDPQEDSCNCSADCGPPPANEITGRTCSDGIDNDCDGMADSKDADCQDDPDELSVEIGDNQTISAANPTTTLTGTVLGGSGPFRFLWSFVNGPSGSGVLTIISPGAQSTVVTIGDPVLGGDYTFQLRVTDASGQSDEDTVVVTVPGNQIHNSDDDGAIDDCIYSLSTSSRSFFYTGWTESFRVIAPSGCEWSATKDVPWITINSTVPGSGNGTVNYSVQENLTASLRVGHITIADQSFTISQSGRDSEDMDKEGMGNIPPPMGLCGLGVAQGMMLMLFAWITARVTRVKG